MTQSDTALMAGDTPNSDLIDQYLTWLGRRHPASTVDTYRSPLRCADAQLPPPNGLFAYPSEIEQWLWGHHSANTRATYRAALAGFFRWAVEHGRADYDPTGELPRVRVGRRLPRPCTHQQLATILDQAPEPVRLWSLVAAYTGARAVEISRLTLPGDITPDVTYLHGKGDRERIVPTHPVVWAAVRDLPPGPLAGGVCRKRISGRAGRTYRRLGVPVTIHRLRAWYATYVQAAAGNARVTQELLGHADLATTQIYTAVSTEQLRAAVLALPVIGAAAAAGTGVAAGVADPGTRSAAGGSVGNGRARS